MGIKIGERFRQCLRRNLLTTRTVKHQLPREVVWSPSLEVFKTRQDKALSNPNSSHSWPCFQQEVAVETLRSLPTSVIL